MAMKTTLNIQAGTLKIITARARMLGISRSEMIIVLLKKAMEDVPDPGRFGRLVRYQERSRPGDFHTFHIKLRVDDYEYVLDLRKLLKMSVSLILAIAVKRFIGNIRSLRKLRDTYKGDKNRFRNYVLAREFIGNVICWRIFWGFPADIGKHLLL
jgi:hypothetical protein